jgi:hypothetical protein
MLAGLGQFSLTNDNPLRLVCMTTGFATGLKLVTAIASPVHGLSSITAKICGSDSAGKKFQNKIYNYTETL